MTAPQKAGPGAGKIVAALLVMLLLPAIVFAVGFGLGIAAVAGTSGMFHEIGVNQEGTQRLEPGEYSVYSAGAFGAEMTITDPDGNVVPQRPVTGTLSTTVDGTTFTAESDVTLRTAGDYTIVVEGLTGSSTGSMAIGPSFGEVGKKLAIPIGIASVLSFLIFIIGLIWLIMVLRARGRAKRAGGGGPGGPGGYGPPPGPGGYPQPGYPQPQQPGYPQQPPPGYPPQPGYGQQ